MKHIPTFEDFVNEGFLSNLKDVIEKVKSGKVKGPNGQDLPRNARALSAQLKKK
jgi:hypothetical protein